MGRVKLTINNWKKRALAAELNVDQHKAVVNNLIRATDELNKTITELKQELRWQEEAFNRLRFNNITQQGEINNLYKVIVFLGNKIPEKEYHNCKESLRNGNQIVNQCSTIDYQKKQN